MRLLLDTHTFLWAVLDHPNLSRTAAELILNEENEIFLSSGSMWEIAIKEGLGKLGMHVSRPFDSFIEQQLQVLAAALLPIRPFHMEAYLHLPFHHRDPFDRLLIAQAKVERLTILTRDVEFAKYDVEVQW